VKRYEIKLSNLIKKVMRTLIISVANVIAANYKTQNGLTSLAAQPVHTLLFMLQGLVNSKKMAKKDSAKFVPIVYSYCISIT
jgi:hypothetical protein